MMKKRINNSLINSYCDRINTSGISLDRKALRNKLNDLDSKSLNDYMIKILNNSNENIINSLNAIGVRAKNNKKISRTTTIINEIKKHFPDSAIIYNQNNNTFSVMGTENITLRLVRENDKYSVQRVTDDSITLNTNSSDNTNSKSKQYTLSNGKKSSKLFADDNVA